MLFTRGQNIYFDMDYADFVNNWHRITLQYKQPVIVHIVTMSAATLPPIAIRVEKFAHQNSNCG